MLKSKKNILLTLFLLTIIAGVYYPVSKMVHFGYMPHVICRFQTNLVDPYDVFRGRYVELSPINQTLEIPRGAGFEQHKTTYAILELDGDGFAKVVDLSNKVVPGKINLLLDARYLGIGEAGGYEYTVYFPFSRYYMNEELAPEAERLLSEIRFDPSQNGLCSIVVKIYADGNFVIDDLEIDGIPVREFIEMKRKEKER